MEQRKKPLEEREQLKRECTERLRIHMNALNRLNGLLPKFQDAPDGAEMATFTLTTEYISEYENADNEEREASAKYREALEKLFEMNAKV